MLFWTTGALSGLFLKKKKKKVPPKNQTLYAAMTKNNTKVYETIIFQQ